MAVTKGCSAYNRLNERLSQSYASYKKHCQDGELGKHPDMYVPNPDCNDEMKPAEHTHLQIIFVQWQPLKHLLHGDLIGHEYNHENECKNQELQTIQSASRITTKKQLKNP